LLIWEGTTAYSLYLVNLSMPVQPTIITQIRKVSAATFYDVADVLATEEPLEIRLSYNNNGVRSLRSLSVTMRTPGNDRELVTGFLYTEGIITNAADIISIDHINVEQEHVVQVVLAAHVTLNTNSLDRNFYTTSSCGVCGKTSIEAVFSACPVLDSKDELQIPAATFVGLPATLRAQQNVFEQTGGLHACALFDTQGKLLLLREDVGRHNAMDKLVGAAIWDAVFPLSNHIVLLSGRASFELMQKAAMAGVKVIAAVGAPSSLAVQMAEEWGITLIGFLRGDRFNIYSGTQRVVI
jgi:FdhD protein